MYPFGDDDTDPSDCEGTGSCDFNDIDSQYTEDLDDLPPYEIRKILRKTTTISLDKFCQAVFGLSSSTLDNWASQVRENRWFHDPIISKYLAAFCTPTHKNKCTLWVMYYHQYAEPCYPITEFRIKNSLDLLLLSKFVRILTCLALIATLPNA